MWVEVASANQSAQQLQQERTTGRRSKFGRIWHTGSSLSLLKKIRVFVSLFAGRMCLTILNRASKSIAGGDTRMDIGAGRFN